MPSKTSAITTDIPISATRYYTINGTSMSLRPFPQSLPSFSSLFPFPAPICSVILFCMSVYSNSFVNSGNFLCHIMYQREFAPAWLIALCRTHNWKFWSSPMICNSWCSIFNIYNTAFHKTFLFHQLLHDLIFRIGFCADILRIIFTII